MSNKMNMFLGDISSQVAGLTDSLGNIGMKLPDIEGSITSALQFENMPANQFPFEMPPNLAASDFYTMAEGSGAQPDSKTPSPTAVGDIASNPLQPLPEILSPPTIPFAEPSKDQPTLDLLNDKTIKKGIDIATQSVQDAAQDAALNIYGA